MRTKILVLMLFSALFFVNTYAEDNKEKITFGAPAVEFPPYIMLGEDGSAYGVFFEVMKRVALDMGYQSYDYELYKTGAQLTQALNTGEVDVVMGLSHSEKVDGVLDFSSPYLVSRYGFIVEEGAFQGNSTTMSQFSFSRIAVVGNLSGSNEVQRLLPQATFINVNSVQEAITLVKYGLADAAYIDTYIAKHFVNANQGKEIKLLDVIDNNVKTFSFSTELKSNKLPQINRAIEQLPEAFLIDQLSRWTAGDAEHLATGNTSLRLSVSDQAWLQKNLVWRFSATENFEPFSFVNSQGEIDGLSIEVLRSIAEKFGASIQFVPTTSRAQALDMLDKGEIDVLPFTIHSISIDKPIAMGQSYYSAPWALVGKKGSLLNDNVFKHENTVIVNPKGYFSEAFITTLFPKAHIILTDNFEDAFSRVEDGSADAVFGFLSVLQPWLDLPAFERVSEIADDNKMTLHMAFAKEKSPLVTIINQAFQTMPETQLNFLANKWLSKERQEQYLVNINNYAYVAVLVVLFCFTAYTLYRNYFLRNRVKRFADAEQRALVAEKSAKLSMQAKTDFLARMSHEIRTPMNGVLGMTEALEYTALSEEQKELLSTLNGSAKNLMSLLNDVLDFSKMEAGKVVLEEIPFALSSVCQLCIDNFRHKAYAKNITLSWHIDELKDLVLIGDASRLGQVVNNLISNAVKFTEQGGIEVRCQLIDKSSGSAKLQIDIRDSGIGMTQASVDKLFNAFEQAEVDTTRKFGGTGLGLTICKEIVSSMKGTIDVSSMQNIGSVFSLKLELPYLLAENSAEYFSKESQSESKLLAMDLSQMSVLFAEDHVVNRKVILGQLKRLGILPDVAENGAIAFEMTKTKTYDVVLSDCHMPIMDGFELAGELSKLDDTCRPYIIALTADAQSGAAEKCLAAGFDDYLSKPCSQELLENKLSKVRQMSLDDSEISELLSDWDYNLDEIDELSSSAKELSEELDIELDTKLEISTAQKLKTNVRQPNEFGCFVDIAKLDVLCGGDSDIAKDIIESFIYANEADATSLNEAYDVKDTKAFKGAAHKLKGSLSYLAIDMLCEAALYFEQASETIADADFEHSKLSEFDEQLIILRAELTTLVNASHIPFPEVV